MDLALNNLQRLICHKTQITNKLNQENYIIIGFLASLLNGISTFEV